MGLKAVVEKHKRNVELIMSKRLKDVSREKEMSEKLKNLRRVNYVLRETIEVEFCLNDIFGITGIYFLKRNNKIVYIGESTCIITRIMQHGNDNRKIFDSFSFHVFNGSHMQRKTYEEELIKIHNPQYNVIHKSKQF